MYNERKFNNFREIVNYAAKEYGKKTAFIVKDDPDEDVYSNISYIELEERYYKLCNHFLKMGLAGKRIAVIGKNCFDWALSYLCAATVGIVVPLDKELKGGDIKDFLNAADCQAICYSEEILPRLDFTSGILHYSFAEVRAISGSNDPTLLGTDVLDAIQYEKDEMRILIFTSGTTGSSKGVCLSQNNICSNIHSTVTMVKITPKDTLLSILPLHHTYECTLDCLLILSRGGTIAYCDGLTRVARNMQEYSPTTLVVVPALLKALNKKVKSTLAKSAPAKYRELFKNESLASALSKTPFIIRKVICSKVRKNFGGKLKLFIVGAAALETYLVEDFKALGIRTLQGYGLTECSPLLAGNSDFWFNSESTGKAIPGVELKIHEPNEEGVGEIWAKGENIMLGYFNDEEATNQVISDGWFHTGDLGYIDSDGHLYIRGRCKNVIVTSNGKNIYPEELETRILTFPEVGEALITSQTDNDEVKVKAKLFPNVDVLKEQLGRIPSADDIKAAMKNVVEKVNQQIPAYKHIKIIDVLTDALEKTTTQKIKRFGKNVK